MEKISEDKEQDPERLGALQPDNQEPDPPDSPTWRAVKKGAKWGSIAGLAIAQLTMSANSIQTPFGSIYGENVFALFAVWIGLGSALGAGIGWASAQKTDSDDFRPPPP